MKHATVELSFGTTFRIAGNDIMKRFCIERLQDYTPKDVMNVLEVNGYDSTTRVEVLFFYDEDRDIATICLEHQAAVSRPRSLIGPGGIVTAVQRTDDVEQWEADVLECFALNDLEDEEDRPLPIGWFAALIMT